MPQSALTAADPGAERLTRLLFATRPALLAKTPPAAAYGDRPRRTPPSVSPTWSATWPRATATASTRRARRRPRHEGAALSTSASIHFVGIGGIGMSGIAEILHNLGYQVQGSDISRERQRTAPARPRHQGRWSATDSRERRRRQVVVVSSAIKADNPEVLAARERALRAGGARAEMLGELMRLKWSIAVGGTHGKTTTTSMVAAMLDAARSRPDGDQRRHHQRLRHQRAARRRRLDGGRGRRERRHLRQAAGDDRHGHQHRSRAPGFLRLGRGAARGLPRPSSRTFPSTASPCSASTTRRCRR